MDKVSLGFILIYHCFFPNIYIIVVDLVFQNILVNRDDQLPLVCDAYFAKALRQGNKKTVNAALSIL